MLNKDYTDYEMKIFAVLSCAISQRLAKILLNVPMNLYSEGARCCSTFIKWTKGEIQ